MLSPKESLQLIDMDSHHNAFHSSGVSLSVDKELVMNISSNSPFHRDLKIELQSGSWTVPFSHALVLTLSLPNGPIGGAN